MRFGYELRAGASIVSPSRSQWKHVDITGNQVRTGTTVIRDVKLDDGGLIFTTRPAPFPGDGKVSVITLVWEKVK